jgi:hypothetical protein
MDENAKPVVPVIQTIPIQGDFPSPGFLTVYVDGATSLLPGGQVVKIYLGRTEPSLKAEPKIQSTPVMQLIMPASGFLQTAVFFNAQMERMIREKIVTPDQVDAAKKTLSA